MYASTNGTVEPPPPFVPPPPSETANTLIPPLRAQIIEYEIQPGDTLWDIAIAFATDPESLAVINEMTNWNRLQPGQTIKVLTITGLVHKAAPGDTVQGIAESYRVDVEEFMAVNNIRPGERIVVGQELILPNARPAREAVMATRGELFSWPLRGRITSYFGYRWGRLHTGIDIAAPTGRPITASRSGTVTRAGWGGGYGNLVVVDHRDGKTTWYAHLSRIAVRPGQWIERGQVLGYVGSTGFSTGPHLHFEIREHGTARNPLDYLP